MKSKYQVGEVIYVKSDLFATGLVEAVVEHSKWDDKVQKIFYVVVVKDMMDIINTIGIFLEIPAVINANGSIYCYEEALVPCTEASRLLYGKV